MHLCTTGTKKIAYLPWDYSYVVSDAGDVLDIHDPSNPETKNDIGYDSISLGKERYSIQDLVLYCFNMKNYL